MTNAEFREVLEDRTAKYAVEVFKYLRELPYDVSTKVIAHQLGKSASSIGANYHEANRSESRDDFVHKVAIAVKEANESCYWFKVLRGLLETISMKLVRGRIAAVMNVRQTYTVRHI